MLESLYGFLSRMTAIMLSPHDERARVLRYQCQRKSHSDVIANSGILVLPGAVLGGLLQLSPLLAFGYGSSGSDNTV